MQAVFAALCLYAECECRPDRAAYERHISRPLNNEAPAMSYDHSFRYCKRCRRSTVHTRRIVDEGRKRLEKHRCTKCDAEATRLLGERPHARS